MTEHKLYVGHTLDMLRKLPDESVDCITTSPPYFGLRDYGKETETIWDGDPECEHEWNDYVRPSGGGHCNPEKAQVRNTQKDVQRAFNAKASFCSKCNAWGGQLGLEPSLELYLTHLLQITAELKRILKPTGVMYWNHGDSYGGSWQGYGTRPENTKHIWRGDSVKSFPPSAHAPPKCLMMQNDRLIQRMIDEQGWILRNKLIWNKCLSGSTMMFAYIDGKPIVSSLKDLLRLTDKVIEFPSSSGGKTKLINWRRSNQPSIHITFRDGFELTCSENHRFMTEDNQLVEAGKLSGGTVIKKVRHNLPTLVPNTLWNYDWGWFIGLYLAEGNEDDSGVRLSLNKTETVWIDKIKKLFDPFGVKISPHVYDNALSILVLSPLAQGVIKHFIRGKTSKGKRLTRTAFLYGGEFIKGVIDGWLDGDGHYEKYNRRWKVNMTRNKGLIDDMRACALLSGYMFRARQGYARYQNGVKPCVRITVRKSFKYHSYNRKSDTEVLNITPCSKYHDLYDIEVEGDHLFTLLNGALTHNSNSMPSSVKDRFSNNYEPIFMLVKNIKPVYYFNIKTGAMVDRKPNSSVEGVDWDYREVGAVFNVRVRDSNSDRFLEKATPEEIAQHKQPRVKKVSNWRGLQYWFDLDSIRVEHKQASIDRLFRGSSDTNKYSGESYGGNQPSHTMNKFRERIPKEIRPNKNDRIYHFPNLPDLWVQKKDIKPGKKEAEYLDQSIIPSGGSHKLISNQLINLQKNIIEGVGKNPGDVFTLPTQSYSEAHFAVFPSALIHPFIKSSCPGEVCPVCGKARVRITRNEFIPQQDVSLEKGIRGHVKQKRMDESNKWGGFPRGTTEKKTVGWTSCSCGKGYVPGVVLDPFLGSGTTMQEAKELGRNSIGIEIQPKYIPMILKRTGLHTVSMWKECGVDPEHMIEIITK